MDVENEIQNLHKEGLIEEKYEPNIKQMLKNVKLIGLDESFKIDKIESNSLFEENSSTDR
jgi:hypothetical protein